MTYSPHPDTEVFPAMSPEDFDRLRDDIQEHGLLEPITLHEGKVLDGRHRQRACAEIEIDASYVEWDSACGLTPLEWVISKNLARRHLSVSQRACLAAELKDRLAEPARQRMSEGGKKAAPGHPSGSTRPFEKGSAKSRDLSIDDGRSDAIAAKVFGIGRNSITSVQQIRDKDARLFDRVKAGEVSKESARRRLGLGPSGGPKGSRNTKTKLHEVLKPLDVYLKHWHEDRLKGVAPKEARKLLALVQRIDQGLLELERALENRTIVSRALQ